MNNDLISREALREAFKAWKTMDDYYHNTDGNDIPFSEAFDLIDTAPAVEQRDNFDIGYIQGLKDGKKAKKGEWIAREDMNHLDENKVFHHHFQCNKCGLIHDFIDGHTSQYNFCPNCGAKMKGGAE